MKERERWLGEGEGEVAGRREGGRVIGWRGKGREGDRVERGSRREGDWVEERGGG